jgi:protocatechuate 3,4-dioxygenase beta subunit
MQRIIWIVLALAALGGAGYAVLGGGGGSERPFDEAPLAADPERDPPRGEADARTSSLDRSEDAMERQEIAMAEELGLVDAGSDWDARGTVLVRGRVVDKEGRPIAGAEIAPFVRRNGRAFFDRGNGGGRGGPNFEPGTDFRALFRDRPLAAATSTGADGTFALAGEAFARGTTVELAVQHVDFAPAVARSDWTSDDGGELVLEDVILQVGVTLTGRVVGPTGAGVGAAEVRFDDAGQGGRGGRGGGPGGGGRFGGGSDRLEGLVGSVETDATGSFSFAHIPAGRFRVVATAPRHVDGRSETLDGGDGATVDVGVIELGPGAELSGIVLDNLGQPVVKAEVTASASREAMMNQARNMAEAFLNGGDVGGGGRGGRGGAQDLMGMFGGGNNVRVSAETDAEGRFVLDRVPQAELRIEVRHPDYVDADLDPVDPRAQIQVQVVVAERPTAEGVVVDAATGAPIESFGIQARRAPGNNFGFGGGRGGRGGNNPFGDMAQRFTEGNPEMAARVSEFQANQERQQQWRQQFLGGSGQMPQRTPAPTAHPEGRFVVEDLQPGEYLLDVDAPGYVRVAAGPFDVQTGAANDGFVIRVERGYALEGRVLHVGTKEPVAGARVSLSIPPLDDNGGNNIANMFGGRGGRGGFGGFGGFGGQDRLDETRTDGKGRFELRPLRAGTYVLRVDADGFPGYENPAFALGPGSANSDIQLDPGARVYGTVLGLEPGKRVRLEFSNAETNERRTANVSRQDGSYEIEGLTSGGYFITLLDESNQDGGRGGMRSRIGAMVSSRAGAAPDLIVPPGGDVRYDFNAASLDNATVRGRVFKNGAPGEGLEVRLVAQVSQTGLDPQIERFAAARLSGLFRSDVKAEDGTFEIESVPPGEYVLEVGARSGGGRGGRGGGPQLQLFGGGGSSAAYSEPLTVRKGVPTERTIQVTIGSLEATLTSAADQQPIARGRVSLVPAAGAGNLPTDQWNNVEGAIRGGLRDGKASFDAVPPGTYKLLIQASGFLETVVDVQVLASNSPAQVPVTLTADPNAPAAGAGPGGQNPRGPGSAGPAGRGGANQGGRGGAGNAGGRGGQTGGRGNANGGQRGND